MNVVRKFKDSISFMDKAVNVPTILGKKIEKDRTLWKRTEVFGSYEPPIRNPLGKSFFNEPIFGQENTVPIGGVQYAMEHIFGVKGTQIDIPTLYSETGIGLPDSLAPTETYLSPDGTKSVIYRYGHFVQLFGAGITGTAENDITVHPVDYREKSIDMSKVTTDGLTLNGLMLPFRYTAETLNEVERKTYFGKKTDDEGITGYYLKRFESDPEIKHIWKTGDDVEDETLVSSSDVWQNNTGLNAIESFTEFIFKFNKKDIKEWFNHLEQEDRCRINTIALFTGRYVRDLNDPADYGDYQDVTMFSKLNIPVEYLVLNKDLYIIYRVYGS